MQDSPPAAGRDIDMLPLRHSAIIFLPYRKFGELSYIVKKLSGKIAGQLFLCVASYRGNMPLWAPKLLPEAIFSLFLSIYFKVIRVLPLEAVVRMHMFESSP